MTSPNYAHHFSIGNVPFGIASSKAHPQPQAVTRLGNSVIFLHDCHSDGLFSGIDGLPQDIFTHGALNEFAALSKPIHQHVREVIQATYGKEDDGVSNFPPSSLEDITQVEMHMPVTVGDFAGTKL
jgi:fumarylacetoacetase